MLHQDLLEKLRQPFPPAVHKERDLPGGGKWLFIPWQAIRDRLNEVCPEWSVAYDQPQYLDKFCIVKCRLTIAGVSREAWGNAPIEQMSSKGRDMSRGTPIERAIADAFKNAAESFGVGAYLDDQEFVVQYLAKYGDMRAYAWSNERQNRLNQRTPPAQSRSQPLNQRRE